MSIDIEGISKRFGSFVALDGVRLHVESGELVALLGPSGSGKTSLLRVIAGLESPDAGSIRFDGEDATHRSVRDRRVGFVFQHYALFRHMSVFENVAFGLRVRPRKFRATETEIRTRVLELLQLVQIEMLTDRYPAQLSGGQRQRVALARALAVEPRTLLLDEPFGALDAKVRKELRRWLRRLHDELHVTSLFVTHDQEEALEVADRVVILNHGRVEQIGRPEDVYVRPASAFVLDFLGDSNVFRCQVESGRVYLGSTRLEIPQPDDHGAGAIYVRPHALELGARPLDGNTFSARVVHINAAGPLVTVELATPWGELARADITRERYQALGLLREMPVVVRISPDQIFVVLDHAPRRVNGRSDVEDTASIATASA